jgi:hypothetical protein
MIKETYDQYKELGLTVIPIEWDVEKKEAVSHRFWKAGEPLPMFDRHNAIMIATNGDYASFDFDLKNTDRKTIYKEWQDIIIYGRPDIYNKLYIEETRNGGYHVWIKYDKLEKKLSLADSSKGSEVIALYAKGPLVYTWPTPGYKQISSEMGDVEMLTDEEFNYLVETSQMFNEYKPEYNPELKAVSYPAGYEDLLSQFDTKLPDEYWQTILNEIGLKEIRGHKYNNRDKFTAYHRDGSTGAGISAKVYFKTKRVMIFSASMHEYPNWHNKHDYPVWSLPPSFILFYKFKRSWPDAIEYINGIIDSIGMDIKPPSIVTDFPMHVFPDVIRRSMLEVSEARSLAPQFVATAGLWTISSLAGSRYVSDFNGDGKNILFCLLIAPVSVGKTPAFRVMCDTPLRAANEMFDQKYEDEVIKWNEEKAATDAKKFIKKHPERYIPIAYDGTTEGYTSKHMSQPNGIGVYQDEAETILNAGSFKSNNDAISYFTQAFSGGRNNQIRADKTKERVVPNMNINLLMGTQPSRLKNIFTEDRLSSGFASRFLMVEADYRELNIDVDPFSTRKEMCDEWVDIVTQLFFAGLEYNNGDGIKTKVAITDSAKDLYRKYYREVLIMANTRVNSKAEQYIIGTEAKMSAYLPRMIQILAILNNPGQPVITDEIVNNGWDLYKYYSESTVKIIGSLHNEIDTGLSKDLELLYQILPDEFTSKEAKDACIRCNLSDRRFEVSMRRKDFGQLFRKVSQGKYVKVH